MSAPPPSEPADRARLDEALKAIRLVVLDVDGTLTDGRVVYVGDEELVAFHVHDGQGLAWLRDAGIQVAWITGRGSRAVERRARELGIGELHLHVADKARVLRELQKRLVVPPEHTLAMGDDVADLALASHAAVFAAPADARPEVRARAALVTAAAGGAGAVRELAERLLAALGKTPRLPTSPASSVSASGDPADARSRAGE